MSYLDRLRLCRYTSPSGHTFEAQFDDLSREGGKKSAVHELPQQDAAIVQDLGSAATKFVMRLYFSGSEYDVKADEFYAALAEKGPGLLAHPRWGDISVLATTYSQTEGFVEGMGQAVFEVSFVFAPGTISVSSTSITGPAVAAMAKVARASAQVSAVASYQDPTLRDMLATKDRITKTLRGAKKSLIKLTGSIKEFSQKINAEIATIEADIDYLVTAPAEPTAALESVLSAAASAPLKIIDKVSTYGTMIAEAVGPIASRAEASMLIFIFQCLSTSASESATTGDFSSRSEAVAAQDALTSAAEAARLAIENAERQAGISAYPETMEAQAAAAAAAAAYLLETSFSLRIERRRVIDGAATPLELVYRFYGTLDRIEEFEKQNDLSGDSLLIVPAGTEVRYYAE